MDYRLKFEVCVPSALYFLVNTCLFCLYHGYIIYIIFSSVAVDELPRVELELNKALCRVKAFKVT